MVAPSKVYMNSPINDHIKKYPYFTTVPLLLPAISLIVGLMAASFISDLRILLAAFTLSIIVSWLLWRWALWQTFGILSCFFWLGMVAGQRTIQPPLGDGPIEAVVMGEPAEKPKTIAIDLLLPDHHRMVRCYVWKDEYSLQLTLGQNIVVRNIGNGFIRSNDWHHGGDASAKLSSVDRCRLWFLQLRHHLLENYKALQPDDEQYAILAAMTLGDKSSLTHDLRETYSITGASHILALSGLHLGIIYLLLYRLTFGRRRFWFSQTLIVLCIWAFAFLTGLSTSVVRSATMISIYALFAVAGRRRSPVNLLCFTAIIMLLINPSSLYDIGFQLSFSAVLSILLWLPLIERFLPELYLVRHPFQRILYNMVGMSLAAQIGAAPFIAYHFGRFSTYFLLTNLFVIPMATIILYGALLVVVLPMLAPALLWVVALLNKALEWLSQVPYASIDGLHPSSIQICLFYIATLSIYAILKRLAPNT